MYQYKNHNFLINIIFTGFMFGLGISAVSGAESVKIINPGVGEKLTAGQDYAITWSPDNIKAAYVIISLLDNAGETTTRISGGIPNKGRYNWSIPSSTAGGEYKIKIYTNDSQAEGISGVFTIEPAPIESLKKTVPSSVKTDSGSGPPPGLQQINTPKPNIKNTPVTVHKGQIVTPVVTFTDPKLEEAVREIIHKPAPATIFSSFLKKVTTLDLRKRQIEKLNGLEYFHSLEVLDLGENNISDISRLAFLDSLQQVRLDNNRIENLEPLLENKNLANGVEINLTGNPVDCKGQAEVISKLRKRGAILYLDCK